MGSLYNDRPNKIISCLEEMLRPFNVQLLKNNYDEVFCYRAGQTTCKRLYFFKDKRGRIHMKLKCRNGVLWVRCIDKESDEWLAYYAYKEIV